MLRWVNVWVTGQRGWYWVGDSYGGKSWRWIGCGLFKIGIEWW